MKQVSDLYAETSKTATFTIGYGTVDGRFIIATHSTDQQGGVTGWGSFAVTASTALVQLGDRQMGLPGKIIMGRVNTTEQCILLDADTCTARLGGRQAGHGKLNLRHVSGNDTIVMDAEHADVTVGGVGADGDLKLTNATGAATIVLDGSNAALTLGGGGANGDITLTNAAGATTTVLNGASAALTLGGGGTDGDITLTNATGGATIVLDGSNAALALGGSGVNGDITIKDANNHVTALLDSAGNLTLGGVGSDGDIHVKNSNDIETITITGDAGDIIFKNADIAEEFEVAPDCRTDAQPGTVMVVDDDGRLIPCAEAYDGKVVGIVAGGGAYRPGIVLDRTGGDNRLPIALVGKVYCRVDAGAHPVRVGDLLTTSPRPGHAMRVTDRQRAFGSIIGKALASLACGSGLIPVLVKPQ